MISLVNNSGISMRDFWMMPLFLVLEMLGMLIPKEKRTMSRKQLIDHEKLVNRRRMERMANG